MKEYPVLLLGLFDTAIITAKCLNKKSVNFYGIDYDKRHSGFSSRIIKSIVCPDPKDDKAKWLEFVLDFLKRSNQTFVLIATSDEFIELSAKYYNELSKYCLALIPSYENINDIIERDKQFRIAENCGLNVPFFIKGSSGLKKELNSRLKFPLVLKPVNITEWKKQINVKGFIVKNQDELFNTIKILENKNIRYLIQNIIDGDNTMNYEVNSLYFPDERLIQHSVRKLRQYPDRYGTATCIEHTIIPELEKYSKTFIKHLNLFGFSNIEFKLNPSDNKYYYIETNPRVWLQVNFSKRMGINFPLLYYNYFSEGIINDVYKASIKGKWVDFLPDILFWHKYHKQLNLSIFEFIRSWFPIKSTALFSLTDPLPFIKDLKILRIIKVLLKNHYIIYALFFIC